MPDVCDSGKLTQSSSMALTESTSGIFSWILSIELDCSDITEFLKLATTLFGQVDSLQMKIRLLCNVFCL